MQIVNKKDSFSNKSIAKSAGVIAIATMASRILGYVRDMIIARLFGTGSPAQAFFQAFRIPNLLRDIVGEGATNAAFIPVFAEYLTKKDKKEFWELANVLMNLMLVILAGISIVGILISPMIVRLIAPGFVSDPEKFHLTIKLTRVMFPYILLVGLTAYGSGILNSLKYFSIPAIGPCLFNIFLILSALLLCQKYKIGAMGLAIGVLLGGVVQLILQIPVLLKKGMDLRPCLRLYHPAARRIGLLLIPRGIGSCVYQLNVFISSALASFGSIVGEGGVAALYYANRIFQLPMAVFGISIATAALPQMSIHAVRNDMEKLKSTLLFSLRAVLFITIPASIGLMVLGREITQVLFERGAFNSYSTGITSSALFYYSIGLFAFTGVNLLVPVFYSLQDTMTPVKTAAFALIINVVLSLLLMNPLKVGGLALAASISSMVNFSMLFMLLRKRIGNLGGMKLLDSFVRILLSSLIMGAACLILSQNKIAGLAVSIPAGIAAFLFASFIFRVRETKELLLWLLKKR